MVIHAKVMPSVVSGTSRDQRSDPVRASRGLAERTDQPQPVHGVHDTSVARHAGTLVRLQLADEMPSEIQVRALRGLRRGLGVAVLADIGQAELAQQPYVGRGVGLGHRDQRDVAGIPPGGITGLGDAASHFGQPRGELFTPR